MAKTSVVARIVSENMWECRVETKSGRTLTLTGNHDGNEPTVEGDEILTANRALITNAWAFAEFRHRSVTLEEDELQEEAEKYADSYEKVTKWLANMADNPSDDLKQNKWCSACFTKQEHRQVDLSIGQSDAFICQGCGSVTRPCAVPGCDNMAVRDRGPVRIPKYCAEHKHEISGFAKASEKLDDLSDYETFLEYDKKNFAGGTIVAGFALGGLAFGIPLALAAAPAIGGAIGTLIGGYSGAAATSYGLALLGGGSLAAGGMGMAGGTAVITAVGASLGAALGASVSNAYLKEDKSFRIEKLCDGNGTPVIVCNGFLTQNNDGWGNWEEIVSARYPDSPVYRVHWGAKELKDLGFLSGHAIGAAAAGGFAQRAAARAAKVAAKRIGPLGQAHIAANLAKNPWHVAKNRAEKTGIIVADLLARTSEENFVLIGHSLGARAMVVAAQALGTKQDAPKIESMHLLGAAIGAQSDWEKLTAPVETKVFNYYSKNDKVLKFAYKIAQVGSAAAGQIGFKPANPKIENIDVSAQVDGHSEYQDKVTLA